MTSDDSMSATNFRRVYSHVQAYCQQFAAETTAHGISRLVGLRPVYIKCLWTAAFIAMAGLSANSLIRSVDKYYRREQNTAYYTDAIDFAFPDVYVCPNNPISGSYSASLTPAEAAEMRSRVDSLTAQFKPHLNPSSNINQLVNIITNTLPFKLLADRFGHRKVQISPTVLFRFKDTLRTDGSDPLVTVKEFYYPDKLRCVRFLLTDADRQLLKDPENSIQAFLVVDDHSVQVPTDSANQVPIRGNLFGQLVQAMPHEWSFSKGWDVHSSSALRLFLAEPDTYPTQLSSTSVLLRPGTANELSIFIVTTGKDPNDLPGECVSGDETEARVKFNNP